MTSVGSDDEANKILQQGPNDKISKNIKTAQKNLGCVIFSYTAQYLLTIYRPNLSLTNLA
jgi:hypothetical protein